MRTSNAKLFWSMLKNIRSGAMNREMIGYSIEEKLAPITNDDVRLFAAATLDENPAYRTDAPAVPPFFLGKLIIPMIKNVWAHPDLRMNLLKTVQINQSVTWHQPMAIGDAVTLRGGIKNIYTVPQGEIIELSGTGYVDDRLVVEGETGFLVKGKKPSKKETQKNADPLEEEFRTEIRTSPGQPLEYAKVTGDNNFIHTSNFLAKRAGLPGAVMHGACVLAMSCATLTSKIADNDIHRLSSISGRFGRPVLPGQKLTVVSYRSGDEKTFPFNVFNADNQPVFKTGLFRIR